MNLVKFILLQYYTILRMLKKTLLLISVFLLLLVTYNLSLVPRVHAANDFLSSYDVSYVIDHNGQTQVNQKITIENLTSEKYIKSYQVTVSSDKIFEITAGDSQGQININIQKNDGKTVIKADFNDQVVGKGKKLVWNLSYKNPEIIEKHGLIWQIDIPTLTADNIGTYNLSLTVPTTLGQMAFMSPQPKNTERQFGASTYIFDKNQFITATFGLFQAFDFNLKYHLKNVHGTPIATEIALPPQTAYQDIFIKNINPPPEDVRVDDDGNWLAKFYMETNQSFDVTVLGLAKLYPAPRENIKILPEKTRRLYLSSKKYWEAGDGEIVKRAQELKSPEKIYQYVADTLKYDPARLNQPTIERYGASKALKNPNSAVCMEFTDLFIALSRAAGIPAREINGYAFGGNKSLRPLGLAGSDGDILHSWPEYWDDVGGWVPVDPTWGATTGGADYFHQFDLNHLVLAIHGLSSTQPFPAGAYKYDSSQSGDVQVTFADVLPDVILQAELSVDLPNEVWAGLPLFAKIAVKNTGNSLIPEGNLQVNATNFRISQSSFNLGSLPPYARRIIKTNLSASDWFFSGQGEVRVSLNDQEYAKNVLIKPFFKDAIPAAGVSVGIITLSAAAFIIAKKSRRISVQKQPGLDNLRGQGDQPKSAG